MYHRLKKKVHEVMHPEHGESFMGIAVNVFLICLILMNVIAMILETDKDIFTEHQRFFWWFDHISVGIFTIEYLLRLWSITYEKKYAHPFWGRLRYMFSFAALIDLMAILPVYLAAFIPIDLRVLRILRLFRFFRLFSLTGYMKASRVLSNVFRNKAEELFISLLLALSFIILSACLMYFAEHNAQPKSFSSIPKTLWWSLVTLTTVGYGDMIPATVPGRILTGVIALAGVALLALPAGIITSGFLEEIRKTRKQKKVTCPHCGKHFHPENHHHEEE